MSVQCTVCGVIWMHNIPEVLSWMQVCPVRTLIIQELSTHTGHMGHDIVLDQDELRTQCIRI